MVCKAARCNRIGRSMLETVDQNTPSILVVDDNPLVLGVVRNLLSANGYKVFPAKNGVEALQILEDKVVEVIVCDVMMPEMNGYELHRQVRTSGTFAHIPFVFLTALGGAEDLRAGKDIGADDYLVKPFEPEDLLATVAGKVKRSRSLRSAGEERFEVYRKKVIHTLSHEFRTPLVAINTGTELLLDSESQFNENKAKSLLEAIARSGKRLEQLVGDFMALQQIEAGVAARVQAARAQPVRAADLLLQIADIGRDMLAKEGFLIRVSNKCGDWKLKVYEPQILDIMMRLFSNCQKFSKDHKVIDLVGYYLDAAIHLELRDRGIGFDAEKLRASVDVFGQLDRDKLEQQGSGLGLAIASRYAQLHNASLEFLERKGGGAIVGLRLPVLSP